MCFDLCLGTKNKKSHLNVTLMIEIITKFAAKSKL